MGRHANSDIRRAFQEFQDGETPSKCNRVRCLHCGFTRAKNTTRQIEHLQECQAYLSSPDAQLHLTENPDGSNSQIGPDGQAMPHRTVLNGSQPNPNLQINRRGPNQNKRNREGHSIVPAPSNLSHSTSVNHTNNNPSLTNHLLATNKTAFEVGTQQPFLSHAGCGTLAAGPLSQWLVQDGHYARGYIRFIGQLLSKVRLPVVQNSQFHPMYRTMDLLISALNNIRREMSFFEITATKYGLQLNDDPPNFVTRAYLDLFLSASCSSASLLEGMVVLWATEHCYRSAWTYASTFSHSLSTPSNDSHIVALHQALIPNWTSPAFAKFVDATKSLVDELANNTTSNGKEEMQRCDEIFKQVCWLEERFWPDVNGMGEEQDVDHSGGRANGLNHLGMNAMGDNDTQDGGQNGFSALGGLQEAAQGGN